MEQIELFHIESPCRGVCQSSAKGFCKGCLRSREERFRWHSMAKWNVAKSFSCAKLDGSVY